MTNIAEQPPHLDPRANQTYRFEQPNATWDEFMVVSNPHATNGKLIEERLRHLQAQYPKEFAGAVLLETSADSRETIDEVQEFAVARKGLVMGLGGDETARIVTAGIAGTTTAAMVEGHGNGCMTARFFYGDRCYNNISPVLNGFGRLATHHLLEMTVTTAGKITTQQAAFMVGLGGTAYGAHLLDKNRQKLGYGFGPTRTAMEFAAAGKTAPKIKRGEIDIPVTFGDEAEPRSIVSLDVSHAPKTAKYVQNPGYALARPRANIFLLGNGGELPEYTRDIQTGTYRGEELSTTKLQLQVHDDTFYHVDGTAYPLPAESTIAIGFADNTYNAVTLLPPTGRLPGKWHPRIAAAYLIAKLCSHKRSVLTKVH